MSVHIASKLSLLKRSLQIIWVGNNSILNIDLNVSIVLKNPPCKIYMKIGFHLYEFAVNYRCNKCKACFVCFISKLRISIVRFAKKQVEIYNVI